MSGQATTFGELLLELRRAAGLTQDELAEGAGLTARSIRDLERGHRARPQRRTVQQLVSALGLAEADAAALFAAGRPRLQADQPGGHDDTAPALLDRDSQLAVLDRAAGEARQGRGTVVLVRASAGMGKSTLLSAWAATQQPRGIRVVCAGGSELEQDFAFALVRQLAEPLVAHGGYDRLVVGPAELAAHALNVDEAGGAGGLPPEATLGLLHSLYWLMVHVTDEGPVALVIDDAHWADGPSVRWLSYLARRLRGLPLLLVLAARSDSGTPVEPLLEQIAGQPDCVTLALQPLSAASVARLVQDSLGLAEPGFVDACAEAAQGSPLLLRELLRALADNGTRPVGDQAHVVEEFQGRILAGTVVKRLASQPEPTRQLARALVVLGDGAAWHVAAELAGQGEAQAREIGRTLRRIGVLAPGDEARFGHPLIKAAIAETVVRPVELAAGHARAAELLRRDGAADGLVAAHLLLAEPSGEAWRVGALREAARATRGRGAPEVTTRYLRRALREPMSVAERAPLLLELGADELQVDLGAAKHHLMQASETLADPYSRSQAAYLLANALFLDHRHEHAVEVLGRAVEDLRHTDDGTGIAREVSWFLQAQMLMIGYEQLATLPAARGRAQQLWEHRLAGDTPGECAVLAALSAWAVTGDASASTANDLVDRALRGGLAGLDQSQMLVSLAGMVFLTTDRLDDAAVQFDQIAQVGGRWGSFMMVSAGMTWNLLVQARRGQQLPLTADFGHPATAAGETLEARMRLVMMTRVGESLLERGNPAAAAAVLAPDADTDRVGWTWQGPVAIARSRVHAAQGNTAAALAVLLEYGAKERRVRAANLAMAPWRSRAALLHRKLGQRTDALQLATEELSLAHRWGTDRAIGLASRCLGLVLGGSEGKVLLRESVAVLAKSPDRLELARSQYEWGAVLSRTGEAGEGRRVLTEALALAEGCGSVLVAGRARRALGALGVHPDFVPAPARHLSLTEHRLVELVNAGQSVRQIAQAMLLTAQEVSDLAESVGGRPGATDWAGQVLSGLLPL